MRPVIRASLFRRDAKRMKKQGKNLDTLGNIILLLAENAPIPIRHKDHPLKGDWLGSRELHIEPDWLLIYHVANDTVYLERTGSHAELFKK
jgi:mRNA interferase YafQ